MFRRRIEAIFMLEEVKFEVFGQVLGFHGVLVEVSDKNSIGTWNLQWR